MLTVDTLITNFAVEDEEAIDEILAPMDIHAVVTIFVVVRREDQIAIPVSGCQIRVVAILILGLQIHGPHRSLEKQISELLEKRARKIEVTTILERIPLVRVPLPMIVDGVGRVRSVDRENLLPREIALPMIESLLVPPRQTSLLTTVRTQSRRRDQLFFAAKYRGHFLVEHEIIGSDFKRCRAVGAGFLHQ